ncbi:MAG: hypothetical protein ABL897_00380, partial [Hyphomicrobium sp.]
MKRNVDRLMGACILGLASGPALAAGPPPRATATDAAPVNAAPLPQRSEPNPLQAMRILGALQDRIAQGEPAALASQADTTREIGRRLAAFEPGIWQDGRHRESLIKYSLSGGDPSLIEAVLTRGVFPEEDRALAQGVVAYMRGDMQMALELLVRTFPRILPPSLAGHIALVQAALLGATEPARSIDLCDEARLLSPGTLVEEAALRLTISLSIEIGDAKRFDAAVFRHLLRFPNSPYAAPTDEQIARVVSARRLPTGTIISPFVNALSGTPIERRQKLLGNIAQTALRVGNLAMAAAAARSLRAATSVHSAAASKAMEGAALVLSKERNSALELLDEAQAAGSSKEIQELIAAAKAAAAFIGSAPARLAGSPRGAKPAASQAQGDTPTMAQIGK